MELELISFKTCPYVQRSRITMLHKGVEHKITYIDLASPPEWFSKISPLGKVPLLRVKEKGKETILFESAVLNEFVDEISHDKGHLMPSDPILRAKTRAWIEYGSNCLTDYYQSATSTDAEGHEKHLKELNNKLARLNEQVVGPYFFGKEFTLADAALAPLMMRLDDFETHTEFKLAKFPKLAAWRTTLMALPAVKESIVSEWKALQNEYLARGDGYLGKVLASKGVPRSKNFV